MATKVRFKFALVCFHCRAWYPQGHPGWRVFMDDHRWCPLTKEGTIHPIVQMRQAPQGFSCPVSPVEMLAYVAVKDRKEER